MAITLTEEEIQFLNDERGDRWTIDEDVEVPEEDVAPGVTSSSGKSVQRLLNGTGRYIKYVHDFESDIFTIYEVYDPPAEQTAQEKLAAFLSANPDVQSLIGL